MNKRLVIGSLDNVAIVSDFPITTTFSEADIREPDKRNVSYAKAVQLYGYNELNVLFENLFQANIATQSFNANLKTEASYYEDERLIFSGYLQLLRITLKSNNIIYDCNIIGETGNFWTDIGNDLLTDLDYSDLDHDYTRANIIQSWTDSIASYGVGYYYPLVNRGTILGDESIWRVRDFLPCLYDYEYLTRILAAKGYTLDSTHCETEFFKRHITYPNLDTLTLSQTELDNRQFNVGRSSDYTLFDVDGVNSGTGLNFEVASTLTLPFNKETAPFFDGGANFTTDTYTVPKTGTYNFSTKLKLKFTITHTNPSAVFCDNILDVGGNSTTQIFRNTNVVAQLNRNRNSLFNTNTGLSFANDNFKTNFENGTPFYTQLEISTGDLLVSLTDTLKVKQFFNIKFSRDLSYNPVRFYDAGMALITTGSMHVKCEVVADDSNTMFYGLVTNKDLIEGDLVEMNNAIPVNIKQKDLIKTFLQRHFLMLQPDKTNPKNLIIEPYFDNSTGNSYYDGEIINLSKDGYHRIDHNKEVVVNPMSELDAKTYIFKYKSDKDYWNKTYEEKHAEVFGTHEEVLENDFIKATKTNELIYSPTHNVANYTLGIAYPKIFDIDGTTIKRFTPNLRSLYAKVQTTSASITFKETGGTDLVIQTYGYAGHTDDPFNPTIDINFGIPKQVFYSYINSQFTTNNLYNRFQRAFIEQISNRDSKMVVAYLWLKKTDIESFSFRNKFFIEDKVIGDGYYRVNKIIEYVDESDSVKCELLKLSDIQVFTTSLIDLSDIPTMPTDRLIAQPLATPSRNVTIYTEYPVNVAASEDIVIGANAQRISVVGSRGINIAEDLVNVSVINSSNLTITESNVTYVDGVNVSQLRDLKSVIHTTTINYSLTRKSGTELVDCTSGNKVITLPDVADCITIDSDGNDVTKILTIIKIDSSGNTVTITPTSGTINGAGTKVLNTQYQSATIQTDGTNWFIIT